MLEINRIVYNYFVLNKFRSRNDMNYALTELKEQQPILRLYHSKMLQMISTKVAGAQEAMDVLKKNGRKTGNRLHYLLDSECNSFTYNQSGYRIEQMLDGNNRCLLHLSKIGSIEIRVHRRFKDVKQITILRQAGRWFAILTCKASRAIRQMKGNSVGIDVGITNYAYDSDGNHVDNPLFMKKDMGKVRRSNKRLSRRVYDSKNYRRALKWHQLLHQRIANRRKDFLHNLSNSYASRYDHIFVERLNMSGMVKNHCMARHILDSSWGVFKSFMKYKSNILEVEPAYTSVECSKCGERVSKTLAVRLHECPTCGVVLDRDYNAALNILQRGLKSLLPMQHGEVTPVETLSRVAEAGTSPSPSGMGS